MRKDNILTCKICKNSYTSPRGLGSHVWQKHDITTQTYYDVFIKKKTEGVCKVCGKPTTFKNMVVGYTEYCSITCVNKSEELVDKRKSTCMKKYGASSPLGVPHIREIIEGKEVRRKAQETYLNRTGKKVWNEGEVGKQTWVEGQKERWLNTLKTNGTFNSSNQEDRFYESLLTILTPHEIERNYNEDKRYPFSCDFYIKPLDLFIELNLHWTHGGHWFNEYNNEDISKLEVWKKKSENSKFYKNAITTWTIRDLNKKACIDNAKLNCIVLWNTKEFDKVIEEIHSMIMSSYE